MEEADGQAGGGPGAAAADNAQADPVVQQPDVPGNRELVAGLLRNLHINLSGRRTIRACLVGERVGDPGSRRWYSILQCRYRFLSNGRMAGGLLKGLQQDTYLAAE